MVVAALLEMFAVPELTNPVQLGAATARGFVDSAGQFVPLAGTDVRQVGTVLYLPKGALPGLAQDAELVIGEVGAETAAGGKTYTAGEPSPIDDGLILAVPLGSGR